MHERRSISSERGIPQNTGLARISLRIIKLLLPFPLRILLRRPLSKPIHIGPLSLLLLRHTTPHISQIRRVSRLDDVIRCKDAARSHESEALAELQIACVRGLVVVQEHEVDLADGLVLVQTRETGIAGTDDHAGDVAQAREVEKGCYNGCEFGVALEGVVVCAAGFADGVGEEER
ncbi:hypothetical protein HG530_008290 [Fusarium avenaceum]|nr:hypothetical protein HG530_008290 [Fusarium avenaceum]